MAPDRTAACQSWICSPCCKSCVYDICAFVLRCFFFSVLTLYSQWSIVWGIFFFFSSSLSSCKSCIFLTYPVFLFCLPRCHMYVVYVWTGGWLISLVLVTSDNKVKSSHLYLYSAFNNTNCNKALHNIKIGKFCQ